MDNSTSAHSSATQSWAPQWTLVIAGWCVAALAGIWIAISNARASNDSQGRILIGLAGVAVLLLALHATVIRPRLIADATGITLRGLFGSTTWNWQNVHYQVTAVTRFGRTVTTLELSGTNDDRISALGRLELGTRPEDVVEQLRLIQPKSQ